MKTTTNRKPFQIGIGWDRHRLKRGLPLVLGGVPIPSAKGCLAHSDGDVLIHAIIDSLLGALGLGDIGSHFPPTDPQYKKADSKVLLSKTMAMVSAAGYRVGNIDTVVITQSPPLQPHMPALRRSLAALLQCEAESVSVKAKTAERCDSVGKGKAIDALASVLLTPIPAAASAFLATQTPSPASARDLPRQR